MADDFKRSNTAAAINALCFAEPFITFMSWGEAAPFTGEIGMDRAIGACLVLALTQAGAWLIYRLVDHQE